MQPRNARNIRASGDASNGIDPFATNGPSVVFRKLTIPVQPRPFAAYGFEPGTTYPLRIGAVLRHAAAPEDAVGWFRYAASLLTPEQVGTVSAATATPGARARFLTSVQLAIQNAFNCLNIVWWNDPVSRAAYRKWVAGPPKAFGNPPSVKSSLFDKTKNYGGELGWFTSAANLAVVAGGPGGRGTGGTIPQKTFQEFLIATHWNPTGPTPLLDFVPALGFNLAIAPGLRGSWNSSSDPDPSGYAVELQNDVINSMFLQYGLGELQSVGCSDLLAFPNQCGGDANADATRAAGWNGLGVEPSFGAAAGHLLRVTTGPAYFLDYLREWMAAMLSRTATEIIQDARAFVVFTNASFVTFSGDTAAQFMSDATNGPAVAAFNQNRPDPAIDAAANAAFAIGGALASSTYGISALVGGAIGATMMVANHVVKRSMGEGFGRDDLGRLKPTMERAFLSGDPNDSDPNAGLPNFTVNAAPAAFRLQTPAQVALTMSTLSPLASTLAQPTVAVLTTPQPGTDAGTKVPSSTLSVSKPSSGFPFGKVTLGAAALFAGYQFWKRGK